MRAAARTDVHRPSAIVPAHYLERVWYSLAHDFEGWPQPPINIDNVIRAQDIAHAAGKRTFGNLGNCGVCGAHFKHGTLFVHEPTGDLLHMGYDCAAKYECLVDASAAEIERDRIHAATARELTRQRNAAERQAFLDEHAGLEAVLAAGELPASQFQIAADDYRMLGAHGVLADLSRKFSRFRELSPKQVMLAISLYERITTPPATRPVEIKAIAPTGTGDRVTFTGEIVSVKLSHSQEWGPSWKCTIKITNEDGSVWLAWGSIPNDLLGRVMVTESVTQSRYGKRDRHDDNGEEFERAVRAELRGLSVEVTATLEPSKERTTEVYNATTGSYETQTKAADRSFAFMKRPSMKVAGMVDHPTKPAPAKRSRGKASPATPTLPGIGE
jgi:hypothetical protein